MPNSVHWNTLLNIQCETPLSHFKLHIYCRWNTVAFETKAQWQRCLWYPMIKQNSKNITRITPHNSHFTVSHCISNPRITKGGHALIKCYCCYVTTVTGVSDLITVLVLQTSGARGYKDFGTEASWQSWVCALGRTSEVKLFFDVLLGLPVMLAMAGAKVFVLYPHWEILYLLLCPDVVYIVGNINKHDPGILLKCKSGR